MTDADSKGPQPTGSAHIFSQKGAALRILGVTDVATPEALHAVAKGLLVRQFGEVGVEKTSDGFAFGGIGLLAQHSSYYDGFAIVRSLAQLVTVVIRPSTARESQIVSAAWIPGEDEVLIDEDKGPTGWRRVVENVLQKYAPVDTFWDVAIVSSIPAGCYEAFLSALAVAIAKAIYAAQHKSLPDDLVVVLRDLIQDAIDAEFSKAFVMVALQASPGMLCVIDTMTEELIPFDVPTRDKLSWALIEAEQVTPKSVDFYRACGIAGQEALTLLKDTPFDSYGSFRDVDHLDLPRVLDTLPAKYRTIVRHLVNENKRVQSMIGAIRGEDWQKLGGLLFISHSSLSNEWQGTSEAIDDIVSLAEHMSADGIYGACMTGRGGYLLLVGLPLALTNLIGQIEEQLQARFQRKPRILIL